MIQLQVPAHAHKVSAQAHKVSAQAHTDESAQAQRHDPAQANKHDSAQAQRHDPAQVHTDDGDTEAGHATRDETGNTRWRALVLLGALSFGMTATACRQSQSQFTQAAADREVQRRLRDKRVCVPDVRGTLTLCPPDQAARAARAAPPSQLQLVDALQLGTIASRQYLREREDVYLAALAVSDARNPFRTQWNLGGSVGLTQSDDDVRGAGDVSAGVARTLTRGGQFLMGAALNVLRNLSGDPIRIVQSILSTDLVLPLARGSGHLVAMETLRQSERDLLYALRSYARFQRSFTVDIASRYYRTLLLRAIWENEKATYTSLEALVEEQAEKAPERIAEFQVDQARQDLLRAEDRVQRSRLSYETSLDAFKRDLGIPAEAKTTLDAAELDALIAQGLTGSPFDLQRAMDIALARRLDVLNVRGQERDALRRVRVARDALRPQIDLVLGGGGTSPNSRPLDVESATIMNSASIVFDLPTERTAERNALRRAMIAALRARRDREDARDAALFEVRAAHRDLEQAARSHRIQTEGVRLAERRVESTELLLEQGRASIRDRLEAQNALVQAQNAVASALVDHVIARLALERDAGVLAVAATGTWTASPASGTLAAPAASTESAAHAMGSAAVPIDGLPPASAASNGGVSNGLGTTGRAGLPADAVPVAPGR